MSRFKRSYYRRLTSPVSIAKGFKMAAKNLKEMQAPGKAESTAGSSAGVHVKSEPVHKAAGKKASTAEGGA